MNRRLSSAALVAAAALTFSLASPIAANAAESGTASFDAGRSATAAVAPSTVSPQASLSAFRFSNATLFRAGTTAISGSIALNEAELPSAAEIGTLESVFAKVAVNGRVRGEVELYPNGFNYPSAWGAGAVRLGPIRYQGNTASASRAEYSNAFRVRQGVKWSNSPIKKRGSKITFRLRGFKTFNGTKWVSVKKVKLQVKKGKKWKTLKNVRVNGSGSKVVKITSKAKRKYRVYIPTTATIQGATTGGKRI